MTSFLVPFPLNVFHHTGRLTISYSQVLIDQRKLCYMCARVHRINSGTGTRTRVARVRAEYPNQLDYTGVEAR